MQTLEGSRDNLNSCMRLIESDKRHDGMVIFSRRETSQREFPHWRMAGVLLLSDSGEQKTDIDRILSTEWVTPETKQHFESFQSFGSQAQ